MLIDSELAEAVQIRTRMDRRMDEIAANRDLSGRAAARERAKAILAARRAMSELRERSDEREATAFGKAYLEAFGLRPDKSAEDRDLRARLDANPPDAVDAHAMMVAALQIGDELQARALAKLAWDHRLDELGGSAWVDNVLQPYGDSSPENDRLITNLITFGGQPAKIDRFRDKLQTEIPAGRYSRRPRTARSG